MSYHLGRQLSALLSMQPFSCLQDYYVPWNVEVINMAKKNEKQLPGKVSWQVVDAWLAIPPCTYKTNPYCHVQCPYFYECNPQNDEE